MDTENLSANTKALQKDIKRAKLFAIQHLTRRIKMLKNKRGTEQQVEKNTRKAARFEEELEYLKELNINIVIKKIQDKDFTDSTVAAKIQQRALDRLISSKPIQGHLQQAKSTYTKRQSSKNDRDFSMKSSKLQPKQEYFIQANISPPSSASDNDSILSDVELERIPTSFFVGSLSTGKKREQPRTKRNRQCETQKENNLNSKLRNDKKPQKERKKSSNRMGQRARQRLWKEQYGKRAKHIKTSDKTGKPKYKTREKVTTNGDQKLTKESKTNKGVKKQAESVKEEASHPSWEASKRRKLQQNISETKFQGQKITFDDSD